MKTKVLIAEDIDSIGMGVVKLMEEHFDFEIHQVRYCDEAYLKIRRAIMDGEPFHLLITDLSFKQDHRNATLENGEDLLAALKEKEIDLPSIVYSIEDRPVRVRTLFNDLGVKGFVAKGRHSAQQLVDAVKDVLAGNTVVPEGAEIFAYDNTLEEIEDYDIRLLKELAGGLSQDEIAEKFKAAGRRPASLSSIEKRLNRLKIALKARNTIQLIANAKDMGII